MEAIEDSYFKQLGQSTVAGVPLLPSSFTLFRKRYRAVRRGVSTRIVGWLLPSLFALTWCLFLFVSACTVAGKDEVVGSSLERGPGTELANIMKITILNRLIFSVTLTDLILFVTFIALIWYAWETRRMRRAIVSQTEIQSTPFISLFIEQDSSIGVNLNRCWVRNDGEGTALNIECRASRPIDGKMPFFENIDVLRTEETKEVKIEKFTTGDGQEIKGDMAVHQFLCDTIVFSGDKEFPFELNFKNILGETYQAELGFKKGIFNIKKFGKLT